jgi:NAD-dependent SIR2 family protein deacetylase
MITFFGEPLEPSCLRFMAADAKRCDLVVVMGTSLKVGGAVWTILGKV